MGKLNALNFTNANNAAMSLHTLAEWVRTGDVKLAAAQNEICDQQKFDLTLYIDENGSPR